MPDTSPSPIPVSNDPPVPPPPGHFEPEKTTAQPATSLPAGAKESPTTSLPSEATGRVSEGSSPTTTPPLQPSSGRSHSNGAAAPNKEMPSLARQAWNLARSLADFVVDGCKTVSADQYRERLEICDACDYRRNNRCTKCGCRLSLKAQGRAFKCPEAKWPAVVCND